MNLNDQKLSGIDTVHIIDAFNASLLKLKITLNENTVIPSSNDLYIYVDKNNRENPTEERKTYLFSLESPMQYIEGESDTFLLDVVLENNDSFIKTYVNRYNTETEEEVDYSSITLFEGENYLYTNYENAQIELIYPKNDDLNKFFLNHSIYEDRKRNNSSDFSLDDIYFKDAFTKSEDKLDIEVNHAKVDCLSSKNNTFSLDSEGNLIVKSIQMVDAPSSNIQINEMLNRVYPVGSIYLSIDETNPSEKFGGTWLAFSEGRMLVGVDSAQTDLNEVGKTGGEKMHTLTKNELPAAQVDVVPHMGMDYVIRTIDPYAGAIPAGNTNYALKLSGVTHGSAGGKLNTKPLGLGEAHNNMPPYITVYMWKRIA